jgi:para-aminobenzoate synthetase component 1
VAAARSADEPLAWAGGLLGTGLAEVTDDPAALDGRGWWAVVQTFEGALLCARFTDVRPAPLPPAVPWRGPEPGAWRSSLDESAYVAACEEVRRRVATGEVYQVNVCRVLEAPLPAGADLAGLAHRLAVRHPAPYAAHLRLPGADVVCASPELFLARDGDRVASGPIKGTGRTAADLTAKDRAENVMIVDLVRNDLGHVAVTGSVQVPSLNAVEEHPGLVHLVSRVEARLRPGTGWAALLAATAPPGSVSGAPKSSALRAVADLEPLPRGPYCGAVGWVDADRRTARLAVGIRTFWRVGGRLRFGTGAGVTWASDPRREWQETELKASRLLPLASGEDG